MAGIWFSFDDMEEKRQIARLEPIVDKAIDFLAPYFGISLDDDTRWDSIDMPQVSISREPAYYNGVIYLPEDLCDSDVGHEVGHWFHNVMNPALFEHNLSSDKLRKLLVESVARYSHIIYVNKINPFQNPRFILSELARLSLEESDKLSRELDIFYNHDLWEESFKIIRTERAKKYIEKI